MHHHLSNVAAEQIPIPRTTARIMNGHVDDRFQLLTHGIQYKRDAAGLGLEQVAKW
ncbi:hypothetical protein D3C80_2049910 [compost metagenome]